MRAERAAATSVHLIVMSRAPVPGRTKTRLIPAYGADAAAAFHAACLADVLSEAEAWRQAGPARGQVRALTLCVAPPDSWVEFARAGIVLPQGAALAVQQGETLGARMAGALQGAVADGDAALLVGSDLPLLSRSHLEAAGDALLGGETVPSAPRTELFAPGGGFVAPGGGSIAPRTELVAPGGGFVAPRASARLARLARRTRLAGRADAVLGPAEDGGYYLIGVRRGGGRWPELLDLGEWGTGTVLQRTLAKAGRIGLHVAQIDSLPDADTPEDLERVLTHPRAAAASRHRSIAMVRKLLESPWPPVSIE